MHAYSCHPLEVKEGGRELGGGVGTVMSLHLFGERLKAYRKGGIDIIE